MSPAERTNAASLAAAPFRFHLSAAIPDAPTPSWRANDPFVNLDGYA